MKYFIIGLIVVLVITGGIILIKPKKETKELGKITNFRLFYTQGYSINSDISYEIECSDKCLALIKPYGISNEDKKILEINDEFLSKIEEIIKKYNVLKWDGFNKSDRDVLDGDSFSFSAKFDDGTTISASGYMMYPDNYRQVRDELDSLFDSLN